MKLAEERKESRPVKSKHPFGMPRAVKPRMSSDEIVKGSCEIPNIGDRARPGRRTEST